MRSLCGNVNAVAGLGFACDGTSAAPGRNLNFGKKEEIRDMSESVQSGVSENTIGALAYFTLIPAIVFLAIAPYNRSAYVRFHAWQSIVLSVIAIAVNYAVGITLGMLSFTTPLLLLSVEGVVWLGFLLVGLWCIVSALNGKRFELPLIGAWAWKQANR